MREVPVVDVDLAVAAVDLDDRRDQRDHVVADVPDVRAVVDGEPVCELHQRRRRAGLGRMDRAGDVVDGRRTARRAGRPRRRPCRCVRGSASFARRARFSSRSRDERFGGDGDGDHLAPLFGRADRADADARARLLEHAHVAVHVGRVRELAGRAGDVAEHGLRRRDVRGGRQVVDERREEERLRRVLADLLRVLLVDRLAGIAAGDRCRVSRRQSGDIRRNATKRPGKGSTRRLLVAASRVSERFGRGRGAESSPGRRKIRPGPAPHGKYAADPRRLRDPADRDDERARPQVGVVAARGATRRPRRLAGSCFCRCVRTMSASQKNEYRSCTHSK